MKKDLQDELSFIKDGYDDIISSIKSQIAQLSDDLDELLDEKLGNGETDADDLVKAIDVITQRMVTKIYQIERMEEAMEDELKLASENYKPLDSSDIEVNDDEAYFDEIDNINSLIESIKKEDENYAE